MIQLKALLLVLPALALAAPLQGVDGSNPPDYTSSVVTSSVVTSSVASNATTTIATPSVPVSTVASTPTPTSTVPVRIRSNRDNTCLHVEAGSKDLVPGMKLISAPCENATFWNIQLGNGVVTLHENPEFALDAGEKPANGGKLSIRTTNPKLPQQNWYLTVDKRIAITNGTQCLDQDGSPQTWQCTDHNTNQIWFVEGRDSGGRYNQEVNRRIVWDKKKDQCITVLNGFAKEGAPVALAPCFKDDNEWSKLQKWDFYPARPYGAVQLHSNPELCLAARPKGQGALIFLEKCVQDKDGQQWTSTQSTFDKGEFRLKGEDNMCLDVTEASTGGKNEPYGYSKELQTWVCVGNDQQRFSVA